LEKIEREGDRLLSLSHEPVGEDTNDHGQDGHTGDDERQDTCQVEPSVGVLVRLVDSVLCL